VLHSNSWRVGRSAFSYLVVLLLITTPIMAGCAAVTNWNYASRKNGTLFMSDWHSLLRPPYIFLMVGCFLFAAAVVWTCIGKARTRFQGWVYCAEEPVVFWLVVVTYYLGGVLFIGLFLCVVNVRDF
jgi:hypothetical protein